MIKLPKLNDDEDETKDVVNRLSRPCFIFSIIIIKIAKSIYPYSFLITKYWFFYGWVFKRTFYTMGGSLPHRQFLLAYIWVHIYLFNRDPILGPW